MIHFFDDHSIHSMQGIEKVPGPVEKLGIVLRPDQPSDGQRTMSFASSFVALRSGGWRLYYTASTAATMRIAVAESADGLHWEKPELGQEQFEGEDCNLLAVKGLPTGVNRYGQPQVFQLDDESWRMYFWVNNRPFLRYTVAVSKDGLHWEVPDFEKPVIYHPIELGSWIWTAGVPPPVDENAEGPDDKALENFVPGSKEAKWGRMLEVSTVAELLYYKRMRANDAAYVFRDPDSGHFEFYAPWPMSNPEGSWRRAEHDNAPFMLRSISRRTSEDGLHWSDAELLITPDDHDRPDLQFYYLAVHRQADWRIGMMGSYPVHDQTMDIELCFSRDGRRWERPVRTPWVTRDEPHEAGMLHAPNCLLDADDNWLLLYSASPNRHNEERGEDTPGRSSCVCAARFLKNRFLGLRSRQGGSSMLWTKPFVMGGTRLYVDAKVDGWLRAELCDPFGVPIAGFTKGKSSVISGNRVDHELIWEGMSTQHYTYNAVSLRLEYEHAELYNIHWR